MTQRPPRPKGAPWLIPYLTVRNAEASIDFYQRAFGFEKTDALLSPEGKILHAEMSWRDAKIMLGPEGAYENPNKAPATTNHPCPISLYLYCEDVDALFARAKEAGAPVLGEPQDMFWGDRTCRLGDADGYTWSFATHAADSDPSKIP